MSFNKKIVFGNCNLKYFDLLGMLAYTKGKSEAKNTIIRRRVAQIERTIRDKKKITSGGKYN